MKSKLIKTILLAGCFVLTSCNNGGSSSSTSTSVPTHTHKYDTDNIVWAWTKSSSGFSATATMNCTTCEPSAEGHTLVLDAEVSPFNEVEPTCTKSGLKKYKAEITYNEQKYTNINPEYSKTLDPLGHKMEYTYDETKHYYRCTREGCEYIESSENHDFSEWEILKEADYGVDGLKTHHCEEEHCQYEEEEVIPALIPTVNVVQEAVDKALSEMCPLTGHRVSRAKRLYGLLSEEDKKSVTGYDDLLAQESSYTENYDVVANKVSPQSVIEGYSMELETEEATDPEYGNIEKAVSFHTDWDWVIFYFNDETVDTSAYTKLSFYIYNPTNSDWNVIVGEESWTEFTSSNQKVPANSWGEIELYRDIFNTQTTGGKLTKYFVGLTNYKGYEAGEKNVVKFSSLFGKKSTLSDVSNVITLIDAIKDDGSKHDAYNIYQAEEQYNLLSETAKGLVTNYDKLEKAAANASYGVASAFKTSQLTFTEGWSTTVALNEKEDQTKGHVIDIDVTSTGGVAEFAFKKLDLDSFVEVSFSIYVEQATKFTLSKADWWTNAYDFSDGTWKASGDTVTYNAQAGWNDLSISTKDFKEALYFSAYFASGNYNFQITPAYGKYTSPEDITNVISLIDSINNDGSKQDAYKIYQAEEQYNLLSETAKGLVTNYEDLVTAKANASYGMASLLKPAQLKHTGDWGTSVSLSEKEDQTKGHVIDIDVASTGGVAELAFSKLDLDSFVEISFSVYVEQATKFTLSKQDWWRDAYDFNDGTWKTSGDYVTYYAQAGWNDLSISTKDFKEALYFSAYFASGNYNFQITPMYGKYTSPEDITNVISLIDKIPSDTSSLQMKDTYNIKKAENAYNNLIPAAQELVTNKQHLLDAIENCQYEVASFVDSDTLAMTEGWNVDATKTDKEDETKGHVSSFVLTTQEGSSALEYVFNKENLSTETKTVYFSIYTKESITFTLSKQDWWTNAYDFSDNSWKANGGVVSYRTQAGWNDLSMSLDDFIEANYFTFFTGDSSVGDEFMISSFYYK